LHQQDEDSEESEENDQYLQLDEDEFQQQLHEIGDSQNIYDQAKAKVLEKQLMEYQSKEHTKGTTIWNSPTKKETIAHLFQNPDLPILESLSRQSGSIRVHK
jgi:reverse gyrase